MWKLQADGVNQEKTTTTTRKQLPLIIITAIMLFIFNAPAIFLFKPITPLTANLYGCKSVSLDGYKWPSVGQCVAKE